MIFKVEITLIGDLENVSSLCDDASVTLRPTLEYHLNELLVTQKFCDVCLHVSDTCFYAHKCILAARSPVFCGMFMSSMSESLSGIVSIEDVEPSVMKEVLHFIYTDTFSTPNALDLFTEELYLISSRYEILGLLSKCEDTFIQRIDMENVLNLLTIADVHGSRRIKEKLIQSKAFLELSGDLKVEVQNAINSAIRRSGGCRGSMESEKKFGSSCALM